MSGPDYMEVPIYGEPAQGHVAHEIQYLVPDELVIEPESRSVHHSGIAQDNRIFQRTAFCKTPGLQVFHVLQKPKGPGWSELF